MSAIRDVTFVQSPDNLLLFHKCPYCRRGDGEISVDLKSCCCVAATVIETEGSYFDQ